MFSPPQAKKLQDQFVDGYLAQQKRAFMKGQYEEAKRIQGLQGQLIPTKQ